MSESQKFYISWDEFHADTVELARKLAGKGPFKGVVAITRGGLIPAGILTTELDVRQAETFCVQSYKGEERGKLEITSMPAKALADLGEGWLVVDDLVDSGKTAELARTILPRATIATVYAKPPGKPFTDIFAREISQGTWIVFPWEPDSVYAPKKGQQNYTCG